MRFILTCLIVLTALLTAGCTDKAQEPKIPEGANPGGTPGWADAGQATTEENIKAAKKAHNVKTLIDSAREKYKASGNPHDAIEELTKALELEPVGEQEVEVRRRLANACTLYGRRLAHQKKYDESMPFFKRAWEADPENSFIYMEYGVTLYEMGKIAEAVEAYDKAIKLKPDYHQAYNARGLIKLDEGKEEEALKDFDKALEIRPDHVWSLVNKGLILDRAGKTDEAIKLFDKAIQLDSRNGLAYSKRGWAHHQKENYHNAVVDYTRAIELGADLDIAYLNRASAFAAQGAMHKAIADYHTFLDQFPGHPRAEEIRKWLEEHKKEHSGHDAHGH